MYSTNLYELYNELYPLCCYKCEAADFIYGDLREIEHQRSNIALSIVLDSIRNLGNLTTKITDFTTLLILEGTFCIVDRLT